MSEHAYWTRVRELVDDGHAAGRPKHEVSADIIHFVEAAADDGDHWAHETLARWAAAGADADYTRSFKDLNTVTYIRANGRRTRRTVAYSRPQREKSSGVIIGRQMQAWWGMSRPAIKELRREMFAQRQAIDDVVDALDQLLAAMDRHPRCATAREAWEADGHSITEIDLALEGGAA
ncbi:hypothetical protein [Streptomyces synnematoformans]|uniref:hypothetical protein n=1 Tax=Streptomyces synnematoformans TaxID=415721 RepID=UPI0031DF68E4